MTSGIGEGRGKMALGIRGLGMAIALACVPAHAASAGDDALNALVWAQSSAEHKAAHIGAFAAARAALDRALGDPDATAALEQGPHSRGKPPAVVLDLDDTVFDTSPYFAWLLKTGQDYSAQTFTDFIEERGVDAVPGAVEYLLHAQSRGVAVFFISNRSARLEEATRDALSGLGVVLPPDEDRVLLKRERRDWGVPKGSRRAFVAQRYRIVQIIGDNLGDFVDDFGVAPEGRVREVARNGGYWGSLWIMLPNPVYGSWEDAALGYDVKLDAAQRRGEKQRALTPWK